MEVLNALSDAKTRIAIYGDEEVIDNLAEFMAEYGAINSEAAMSSFNKVIASMRKDAGGYLSTNTVKSISTIIFGIRDQA